jgi:hypothetical protein
MEDPPLTGQSLERVGMIIVTAVDEDDGFEVYAFHCANEMIANFLEGKLIVCGLNVTVQRPFVRMVGSEDEIDQAVDLMIATARPWTRLEER